MMILRQFKSKPETIPATTSWYLADLGEAKGKQELFTKQSPEKLKVLRENAMIESAVSSNRIEGVTVRRVLGQSFSASLRSATVTRRKYVVTGMPSGSFTSKVRNFKYQKRLF